MLKVTKGSKYTVRQNLEGVYKQTGIKPKKLANHPKQPADLDYLIRWYSQLIRSSSELSYTEIAHFSQLMKINIKPWEIDIIMRLFSIFNRET